eukprot:2423569-Pleurochrysis_carterae.AAC.2
MEMCEENDRWAGRSMRYPCAFCLEGPVQQCFRQLHGSYLYTWRMGSSEGLHCTLHDANATDQYDAPSRVATL